MISGNILLTAAGMNLTGADDKSIKNFCDMREKAFQFWKDQFYTNDINLYSKLYLPELPGISNHVKECLQNSFLNFPKTINSMQFAQKPEPRTEGGFEYSGHPTTGYVYDCNTLKKWHTDWNRLHTDCVEWEDEIFPFKSAIIEIMKEELCRISLESAGFDSGERKLLLRFQRNQLNDDEIVTAFHNLIVKHKGEEERIAYVCEIGGEICEENGYQREQRLENLEQYHGNCHVKRVYSIKNKSGKYIFLSIDKRHGMFEWCADDGSHLGERRLDGSHNSNAEADHSLKCVAEWKGTRR